MIPRSSKGAVPVHLSLIDRFFRRLETWPIPPAVTYALLAATGALVLQTSLWVCGASPRFRHGRPRPRAF